MILTAVSKTQAPEAIDAILATGQRIFGENRVQEAQGRWADRRGELPGLELRLIGPLQTNKAAEAVALFDVIETGISLAVSSVALFSLDDIAFVDNQCDCNLVDDVVIAHVVLFGFSLRACDNRLKESLLRARFSALTLGFANTTAHNQATHCLLVRAFNAAYRIGAPNTVLIDPLGTGFDFSELDSMAEALWAAE